MFKIRCKFLGQPLITEDGQKVNIPGGKLRGLLYYLLVKKITSRDELAGIFWPESNEQRAKASLRNAIHKIRKSFKSDIILSPNKSTILINEKVDIELDIFEFEKDPIKNKDLYSDYFLKGVHIKNSEEFENWLRSEREYYLGLYRKGLEKIIVRAYENQDYKELEENLNSLLALDSYNEKAHLYLIKYYQKLGRHDKVINKYHYFKNLMQNDLGVPLKEEITRIYNRSLQTVEVEKSKKSDANRLYLREYEINLIEKYLKRYREKSISGAILISGEVGVGKTSLIKEIKKRKQEEFIFLETQCMSIEKEISYAPWIKIVCTIENEFERKKIVRPQLWQELLKELLYNTSSYQPSVQILEKKAVFNMETIFKAINSALNLISKEDNIIIIIEDLHWADQLSIKLLASFILKKDKPIFFLISKTSRSEDQMRFLLGLRELGKLKEISLEKFSKTEVFSIVRNAIGSENINQDEINSIYEKSKGNSFFLNEYIRLFLEGVKDIDISCNIEAILKNRFSVLTDDDIYILSIFSQFYDKVELNFLLNVIDLEPFTILKSLNRLISLDILKETVENDKSLVEFEYSAYKSYFNSRLNEISKKIIHKEIAEEYEKTVAEGKVDISKYIKLEGHFRDSDNRLKATKYKVHILNYYLNYCHELFPDMDDYDLNNQVKMHIKNDRALTMINEVEKEILLLKNDPIKSQEKNIVKEIELLFLYCKGRYFIRGGNYKEGINLINRVIRLSNEIGDKEMEIVGRKQMIIYGIQINDPDTMIRHLIPGIKAAKKYNRLLDMGVFNRLYGVYNLMLGDFVTAEELFNLSIEIYSNSASIKNANSISIAANYNYIGGIRRSNHQFNEALDYYKKAIGLIENMEASCLSIFYLNAGITSFLMDDYRSMKTYLDKAERIVRQFDSYWKKPVVNAFLSLNYFIEGNYEKSISYMRDAMYEIKTINNTRNIGYVYFVKAIISDEIQKLDLIDYFKDRDHFTGTTDYYFYQALKYLDQKRDKVEIEYLKERIKV